MRVFAILVLLLVAACGSSGSRSPSSTGTLAGRVVAQSACTPEGECLPKPVAGALVVVRQNDSERARATTSADGRFRIQLAPGHYDVAVTGPVPGPTAKVDIVAGQTFPITLNLE